jgi:hypothetical protein
MDRQSLRLELLKIVTPVRGVHGPSEVLKTVEQFEAYVTKPEAVPEVSSSPANAAENSAGPTSRKDEKGKRR